MAPGDRNTHPSYGNCYRCQLTWATVKGHMTQFVGDELTGGTSLFPLCEDCWQELTPQERLPFYRQLWLSWHQWGPVSHSWEAIEKAVMGGL